MANLSKITLPNGTTYDIKDARLSGIYSVKGTQTANTASWTGVIDAPELYDGMTIAYYLPRNSASNATLNLTLSNGTKTGAKNVYVNNTTRMGTHHGAGSTVILTYWSAGSISVNGTATTDDRWTKADYWNSNTIGEYAGSCVAGTNGMARYSFIMQTSENTWESLVLTSTTAATKSKNSNGFLVTSPILYQSGDTYSEGAYAAVSSCWSTAYGIDTRYSINDTNTWSTGGNPFFLVGTISNGKFYLSNTWWSDTLPTSEDNLYYWYVGQMYSAYQCTLYPYHPIYYYKNDKIRVYSPINALTVNDHTVEADVPSGAKFTDTVTSVKGNAETTYRTGQVNLTPANVGAIPSRTNSNTQELYRPLYLNDLADNTLDAKYNTLRANRLAFLPADQIIIEKTTDGGTTWVDAGISDSIKSALFAETRPSGVNIPLLNGVKSLLCGLRITITAMKYNVPSGTIETEKYNYWNVDNVIRLERYCQLSEMYFWINSNSDTISVKVEKATGASPNVWTTLFDNPSWGMTGWSGNDYIRFATNPFGGGTKQSTNPWNYRITLMTRGVGGTSNLATTYTTATQSIMEIRGYGNTWWNKGNEYMANDKIYTHDYNQNVTFPSQVSAVGFNGKINNHTVNSDVPANAKFTDTTYESKAGVQGGTELSLVTTGEKFTWNNTASTTGTITGITTTSPLSGGGTSGSVALSHEASGVTAGSYGQTTAQTPGFGGTFSVPSATVDAKGHVTAMAAHNVTIPSAEATTTSAGLMSAADKTKINDLGNIANLTYTVVSTW